jgi:hypothetical protein
VAISVAWQTVSSVTSAATVYTIPSASTAAYGLYARDLVINNSGTVTLFVGLSSGTVSATTTSFQVPAGGTVLLTQCQVPSGLYVSATAATGTGSISVGYATNVNYF